MQPTKISNCRNSEVGDNIFSHGLVILKKALEGPFFSQFLHIVLVVYLSFDLVRRDGRQLLPFSKCYLFRFEQVSENNVAELIICVLKLIAMVDWTHQMEEAILNKKC